MGWKRTAYNANGSVLAVTVDMRRCRWKWASFVTRDLWRTQYMVRSPQRSQQSLQLLCNYSQNGVDSRDVWLQMNVAPMADVICGFPFSVSSDYEWPMTFWLKNWCHLVLTWVTSLCDNWAYCRVNCRQGQTDRQGVTLNAASWVRAA